MTQSQLIEITCFTLGGLFNLGYFLLGCLRKYLLFVGVGFLGMAGALLVRPDAHWVMSTLATLAFLLAFADGIRESRDRLRDLRADQQHRERAFAETMTALAHQDSEDLPTAKAPPRS